MSENDRRHETRTLGGGETLGLDRISGEKWRIAFLEDYRPASGETVKASSGANRTLVGVLSRKQVPPEWAEMPFDSADDAAAFVEDELAQRRV